MEEAEFLCSRIGIIDYGKLIAEGTNQELQNLVTDRKTIVVKTSIGKVYDLRGLNEIKGVLKADVKDSTVTIETLREADVIGAVVNFFEKNEFPILDIQMKNANLETIFLSLTGRKLRQ
jgi:ABC-2 type transport system ATP-binding protein